MDDWVEVEDGREMSSMDGRMVRSSMDDAVMKAGRSRICWADDGRERSTGEARYSHGASAEAVIEDWTVEVRPQHSHWRNRGDGANPMEGMMAPPVVRCDGGADEMEAPKDEAGWKSAESATVERKVWRVLLEHGRTGKGVTVKND